MLRELQPELLAGELRVTRTSDALKPPPRGERPGGQIFS